MTHHPQTSQHHASHSSKRRSVFWLQCLAGVAVVGLALGVSGLTKPARDSSAPAAQLEKSSIAYSGIYARGTTGSYLAGRYAANVGDFRHASAYLSRSLQYDPDNREMAGYTYRMYLITGDMEKAAAIAQELYEAGDSESNPEIMMLLSQLKRGDYVAARTVLNGFERSGFNLVVLPLLEAWLDYADGALAAPLKQNEILRRVAEFAPFIHYQTALINDIAGFEDEAIAQYNEALNLSRVMPYRVVEMLGNLYARRGEWDKAEELYLRYRGQNPDSLLLAPALESLQQRDRAPARLVANIREGIAEIFFSTASILHNEKLNEEALIYIQQVLYLNPDFMAARLMRGTIYEELNNYAEALVEYENLPRNTPYYYKGQIRKAYTLNALTRNDEALKMLDALEKTAPNRYQVQLTRGDILMRSERYGEAAVSYSQALAAVKEYKTEHWPIFYARGISYERAGEWDKAEQDFLKALEIQPGQPDVLNYLGYSWLTQNTRIKEAKEMIEMAVKARPDDAHIIDSMGWALYKVGDYAGAVEYLERAIEMMPTDPTVNDHLGDAYWRSGRRNEARFQWQRALMLDPEPEQVEQLNVKLANGLPPAGEPVKTAENEQKPIPELRQN